MSGMMYLSPCPICLDFAEHGIRLSKNDARILRKDAATYIKKHKLRQNSALYTYLNDDDAWCTDFKEFYIDGEKHYLLKIIDDNSGFDIATAVLKRATTANVLNVVNDAIKRWCRKPLSINSD
jgi:hypothetical protein